MLLTLTTDFGPGGRYVAQMKGVLYSRAPGVTVVDLSHDIPPQDIAAAARLLEAAAAYWPAGTTHLAVIDPGVGTERPIVVVEALKQRFIGPDNGLFGWLEGRFDECVALSRERLAPAGDSCTFHGRDLMAPAAALLLSGTPLKELGAAHASLQRMPMTDGPRIENERIEGRVAEVDHYGNLITNISADLLKETPRDERLRVTLGEHETYGLWQTYGENPPQTLVALVGSEGFVEVALVNGNAAEMLGAGVGDAVCLNWSDTL
ncbi:SAM hydrolase/SAM-dependent halogenase family protein [Botrimarina mediterranea]|uniref:Adenosyl-chloride synthase n=1 Tax=Botrimarina mediterranea TaxID=2528022 RepID=A0A518KC81_9BACT|nr:SAM-dependent chlorinase/fluorinase [Botrimarina mediterranea]QDV75359.1 Adenosyl-chloride synthase [Botrimarina mediterranea]